MNFTTPGFMILREISATRVRGKKNGTGFLKWAWGGVRGSEWQRQPTELISWRLLLSPTFGTNCRMSHWQHFLCTPKQKVPTATQVWVNHFPSLQPPFPPPLLKSYFPIKKVALVFVLYFLEAVLSYKERWDPNSGPRSSTKAPLDLGKSLN